MTAALSPRARSVLGLLSREDLLMVAQMAESLYAGHAVCFVKAGGDRVAIGGPVGSRQADLIAGWVMPVALNVVPRG